jgi:hypothetical protein
MQLGSTLRDARRRRELAEAARQFEIAEQQGISPEQIGLARSETEALAQQDAQEFGLDTPQQFRVQDMQPTPTRFRVGDQDFGTREEATRAARPMRAEGLANVYERYGDIERAEDLRERADAGRMRGLQLEQAERTAAAQKRVDDFSAWRAENPDISYQEMKDAARTQFKLTDDQLLGVVANISGLQEGELKIWKNEVQDLIKGKNLDELVEIYNTDDRFDPDTDIKISRRGGRVSVAVVGRDGNTISTESFESDAAAQAYLRRQALEPDTLADWLLQRKKIESGIQLQGAQAARAGRSSMQEWAENFTELMGREPTQEEIRVRMGVEGRPSAARVPTAADINARARMYLDNDRTNTLTVQEATALAERDFGLREGPTNQRASLVDQAISGPAATAPRATATPAGQQLLGLYNTLVPPEQRPAIPQPGPRTSQERLQQLYR